MKFLWIFEPDASATLFLMTGLLWPLGGSGVKFLRGFGVPIIIGLSAWSMGAPAWMAALTILSLLISLAPGYGDDFQKELLGFYWPYIFLISAVWGASLWPLAFFHGRWLVYGIGIAAQSLTFGLTMLGSKKINFPTWKWCEIATGAVLGLLAFLLIK